MEQEKQKIAQNPVKERKQLFDNYIEKAVKSKITIDNTIERQEKERNRVEQMKVVKEEEQVQKRRPGYRM